MVKQLLKQQATADRLKRLIYDLPVATDSAVGKKAVLAILNQFEAAPWQPLLLADLVDQVPDLFRREGAILTGTAKTALTDVYALLNLYLHQVNAVEPGQPETAAER